MHLLVNVLRIQGAIGYKPSKFKDNLDESAQTRALYAFMPLYFYFLLLLPLAGFCLLENLFFRAYSSTSATCLLGGYAKRYTTNQGTAGFNPLNDLYHPSKNVFVKENETLRGPEHDKQGILCLCWCKLGIIYFFFRTRIHEGAVWPRETPQDHSQNSFQAYPHHESYKPCILQLPPCSTKASKHIIR